MTTAEREAVSAAERAERKLQLRDKVSAVCSVSDCFPSIVIMRSARPRNLEFWVVPKHEQLIYRYSLKELSVM